MTVIHFVRHGKVHNPERVLYVRQPGRYLSTEGHRQAQCVAEILKFRPVVAVFSSPMPRAVQTADYIAYARKLTLQTSEWLHEVNSPFQGWPEEILEQLSGGLYSDEFEGYEQWTDVYGRTQQFCREACAKYPNAEIVAVTHGDVILSAHFWARDQALTPENRHAIPYYPSTASITSLTFASAEARPQMRYNNPFAVVPDTD